MPRILACAFDDRPSAACSVPCSSGISSVYVACPSTCSRADSCARGLPTAAHGALVAGVTASPTGSAVTVSDVNAAAFNSTACNASVLSSGLPGWFISSLSSATSEGVDGVVGQRRIGARLEPVAAQQVLRRLHAVFAGGAHVGQRRVILRQQVHRDRQGRFIPLLPVQRGFGFGGALRRRGHAAESDAGLAHDVAIERERERGADGGDVLIEALC